MGLSKGQKQRRYGENTRAHPQQVPGKQPPPRPRSITDYSKKELAPRPEAGSSYIFLGVSFVVTLLFGLYYHLMLLPAVSESAGTTAPELLFWFSPKQLQAIAGGLGAAGLGDYQILHRSSGLIYPLIFAFTWWNLVRASNFEGLAGKLMLAPPLLYALVFISGGFLLDIALANPSGGATLAAALLVAGRWLLLLLCLAQLAVMGVRLVRGKLDTFARGELPGQQ